MHKKIMPLLFLLLICLSAKAQNVMVLKDGKQYSATPVWELACDDYTYGRNLMVQVAKTATGGILKIQVNVSNGQFFIADRVMIFLENGKTLYCSDKGLRENAEGVATSYYYFTPTEMEVLRKTTLKNIRFKIIGKPTAFTNKIGYFTASNRADYLSILDKPNALIDTKTAINLLYSGL